MYLSDLDIQRVHEASTIILQDITRHRTVAELSRMVAINATKLHEGFKIEFGLTIYDFLVNERMNLARRLLTETRKSISEIARLTGYKRQDSFAHAFKRQFGYTPTFFRKSNMALVFTLIGMSVAIIERADFTWWDAV